MTLRESADQLAKAGHAFWSTCREEAGGGAVRWLDFSDGTLIIFTRGEYRESLLAGVHDIPGIPVMRFQDDGDEEADAVTAVEHVAVTPPLPQVAEAVKLAPLDEPQLRWMWETASQGWLARGGNPYLEYARAVEKHHGIGPEQEGR
jgi:hypothetical protein